MVLLLGAASPGAPGCGALYRSSCRKGMELTTAGARAGYMNSVAEKSPEELLRMNRRGVK